MNNIETSKKLSPQEEADFLRLHTVVSKWLDGWEVVAAALTEIRDRQLYRRSYVSFDAYCKAEFAFGKRRGYQLTEALEVKNLIAAHDPEAAKLLDNPGKVEAIKNMPLTKAVASLRKAAKSGKKVTAKTIKIASTPSGKETAADTLGKVLARLEALKTQKVTWKGAKTLLDRIVETALELREKT